MKALLEVVDSVGVQSDPVFRQLAQVSTRATDGGQFHRNRGNLEKESQ